MIPWTRLATSPIPGAAGELRLMRRGSEVCIFLGTIELMNSRRGSSEAALATLACARLQETSRPRLLIGGLGMGFTLRAALSALGPAAEVVVAELVPAVVEWARGPMAELFAGCLDDPRVCVVEGDVAARIRAGVGRWDAILLDVDNGPDGLTHAGNDALYGARGLGQARRALRPGGLLAIWSVAPDAAFAARMTKAGFAVEEIPVRAHAGRGPRHVVWVARG